MAQDLKWPGSGSSIETYLSLGIPPTKFGYYDTNEDFKNDAPRVASWCATRLGYPVMNVELIDLQFYTFFEEAIIEYSSQVHQFTIRENMLGLTGAPNDETSLNYVDYTNKPAPVNLSRVVEIAEQYAQEATIVAGGNVTHHKGYIDVYADQQTYDLDTALREQLYDSDGKEAGTRNVTEDIEIKRVYHYEPIAFGYGLSGVYNAPGVLGSAGGWPGVYGIMSEFGWEGLAAGGIATGLTYTLMPVYEDLLRMQAIEFNYQIRRSGFGFELKNNKLTLFPYPKANFRVWVDFIYKSDRQAGMSPASGSSISASLSNKESVTTNIGDAPYGQMSYNKMSINAKKWIFNYTLAVAKESLGEIRSKYATIPIPNSEVVLNGETLKQEAQTEKESLIERLREDLDESSLTRQLEKKREQTDNLREIQATIPIPIIIG